jgi:hypothetical protein
MTLHDVTIRTIRLQNNKQHADIRHQIGRLLYQVYIKEQQWTLEPNNPSSLRIVENNELVDNIDEAATWIVAMKDNQSLISCCCLADRKVIGCCRLVDKKLIGGIHEVQRYLTKDSPSWKTIDSLYPCLEANRMAVALRYRRSLVGTLIMQQVFSYLHSTLPDYGVFTCTGELAMQSALESLGDVSIGEICVGEPFRYNEKDLQSVKIYWCSSDIMIIALNRALYKINQSKDGGV